MSVGFVFTNKSGELVGCDVINFARRRAVSCQRSSGDTDENLGVRRWCAGNGRHPLVVVERCVAVEAEGAGVGVVVVIVELDEEVVKLGCADDLSHIWFWDWALRCTSDVVSVARVFGEVGS